MFLGHTTLLNRLNKVVSKVAFPSLPFCRVWIRARLLDSKPLGVPVSFAGHVSNTLGPITVDSHSPKRRLAVCTRVHVLKSRQARRLSYSDLFVE